MKYKPRSWNRIGVAMLPSLLIILQIGQALGEKSLMIFSPIILIVGIYLVIASYKEFGHIKDLNLPCIGVIFLEFWMLSRLITNPHTSLLLTRGLFIILSLPSMIILYKLRSNLNNTIWLVLILFVVSLLLTTHNTSQPWIIFGINFVEWLIYIIPLFSLSLFYSLKSEISVSLALSTFAPFWISYNLDPLGTINHTSLINANSQFNLALFAFQVIPVLGFLIIMPISIFRSPTHQNSGWKQIIYSLLIIVPVLFIRFTVLKEAGVNYLFPLWLMICIHIVILWFPFLLPLSLRETRKVFEPL